MTLDHSTWDQDAGTYRRQGRTARGVRLLVSARAARMALLSPWMLPPGSKCVTMEDVWHGFGIRPSRPRKGWMIEPQEFRSALSRFPSGVTVVTVMGSEDTYGITVSSFMSVSLEPPLIAVSIGHGALVHDLLLPGRHFGVSVLKSGQERVSDLFAGRPVHTEDPLRLIDGFPFVDGALARLLCRVDASHEAGDHTIFVGEVERLGYEEGVPLVYHRGRYARTGEFDLID